MDDLISRQHAIDNMAMVIWDYPNEIYPLLNDMDMALQLAKDGLMGVPSVDAIEVVRCKDCIHNQYGFCEKVNHNTGYVSTCADVLRAEKRENDGRFKNDT